MSIRELHDMDLAYHFYRSYSVMSRSHYEEEDEYDIQETLRLRPVSRDTVAEWFSGEDRVTVGYFEGDSLIGMASGVAAPERKTAFLSYIAVMPVFRCMSYGTAVCNALEERLMNTPGVEKLEVVFHNPVHLPWLLPGKDFHEHHPCVPGVDMASRLYIFLKNRGWRDYAYQNVYYCDLSTYKDRPEIMGDRLHLASEGIELTMFNDRAHYGLPELFDNIQNPGWKAQVLAHLDRPIVVAVDKNVTDAAGRALVVSYTGPLSCDGHPARGNFCGIGTRTEYRGRGIGKQVFCTMCRAHRKAGAAFMSLYTGFDNPARFIYEAAGFRVVRSFANMRKCRENM